MKHKNISPLDEILIPFSAALLRSPTSVVRPSTIYSFNFFSRTAWWIFMTLGREKELVVPYWCCYFSCESAKGYIQGGSNISHMFINTLWNENSFQKSYRVSLPIQPTLEFYSLKKNCDGPAYHNGPRRYQYVINLFMAAIFYIMHGKCDKYKYTRQNGGIQRNACVTCKT